ncbi:MAG: hypothetical protein ACYTXT_32130 [Nostoc sp.]
MMELSKYAKLPAKYRRRFSLMNRLLMLLASLGDCDRLALVKLG